MLVFKTRILRICLPDSPNTRSVSITMCFASFEQVLCDDDHVSATRSQPPIWQSMPRSDTQCHRIAVFCRCFRETLCCQLGLGDWLASQSPNQVDSNHGVNNNCQPTTKSIIFDHFLGYGPPTYANSLGFVWFCAPYVKHHAQLDNSWSQTMPN